MDNITLARLLDETAALLEIDAADPFRIRSYRRAAEAVEQQTTQLATLATPTADPKLLLAVPGIGGAAVGPDAEGIRSVYFEQSGGFVEEACEGDVVHKARLLRFCLKPGHWLRTISKTSSFQVTAGGRPSVGADGDGLDIHGACPVYAAGITGVPLLVNRLTRSLRQSGRWA